VTVTVSLYSTSTGKYSELATVDKAGQMASCSNVAFTNAMSGACSLSSEVNILNNRYHVMMNGSFQPKTSGNNVVITITGKEGQQVYCYGYSKLASYPNTQFSSNRMSGFTDGSTDGSISDMACALNVIAVGAYTTRTSWPTFAGTYSYTAAANLKVDEVSSFSSYGTTYQGVELPVSCAPGANIISSLSRYYTKNLSASTRNQETSASVAGSSATDMTAYWGPMQGTSMSCPYLAGTMALWLEADPTLTVSDCVDILRETSILPETSIGGLPGVAGSSNKNKQWGGGRLDALEGIKEVIRRKDAAGIDNVMADGTGYVITPAGDRAYNIMVDGAASLTATICNMQGVTVASAGAAGNELTIDAAGVQPGAYILTVEAPNAAPVARKIVIR
ncbi:MAG: S8 family serine peptidase, partial [Muribaculaceae bacterium]|nr:S8 family serine peptidase [Muribaculaceae bacterium]